MCVEEPVMAEPFLGMHSSPETRGKEHSTQRHLSLGGRYLPISSWVSPLSCTDAAAMVPPDFRRVQVVHQGYAMNLAENSDFPEYLEYL